MNNLGTLCPEYWMDLSVIDVFLAHHYTTPNKEYQSTYLLSNFIYNEEPPTEDEINLVSSLYTVYEKARPIVFIRHAHQHFFVVIFDYLQFSCLVYGRHFTDITQAVIHDAWTEWNGPALWTKVSMLLGLGQPETALNINAIQWNQV